MESNKKELPVSVPYVVHRDAIDDNRWVVKRLTIALIVAIALIFVSNMAWLFVWQQYDYSTETVTTTADSEGDGMAINITGGNGGVTQYGPSDSSQADGYQNEAVRFDGNKTSNQDAKEVTDEPGD